MIFEFFAKGSHTSYIIHKFYVRNISVSVQQTLIHYKYTVLKFYPDVVP